MTKGGENADLSNVIDPPRKKTTTFADTKHNKTTPNLAYGAKKRMHVIDEDYTAVDRVYDLEKENLALKEKENLLEREINK